MLFTLFLKLQFLRCIDISFLDNVMYTNESKMQKNVFTCIPVSCLNAWVFKGFSLENVRKTSIYFEHTLW